jgi:hypothetical protein
MVAPKCLPKAIPDNKPTEPNKNVCLSSRSPGKTIDIADHTLQLVLAQNS